MAKCAFAKIPGGESGCLHKVDQGGKNDFGLFE
jgi:hypothetical protein